MISGDDQDTRLPLRRLVDLRHEDVAERHGEPSGLGRWHGPFRGRRRGQGMDFDDLRPYAAGDDIRHIDWRSSARRDRMHTRLFREEKDHVVTIAVDLRASMFTGSQRLRAVEACELAARLLWRASAGGCRVSVICLREEGLMHSRQGSGERGALEGCRQIAESFAQARQRVHDKTVPELLWRLDDMLASLLDGGRRLGSSIVISGGDDPGDEFEAALARHRLARPLGMILITDPIERQPLPQGRYRYVGAHGATALQIDSAMATRISAQLAEDGRAREALFEQLRVPLLHAHDGVGPTLRRLRDAGLLA